MWWNLLEPGPAELDVIAVQAFEAGFLKGMAMIKVNTGPAPSPARTTSGRGKRNWSEVVETARTLAPQGWFVVPGTEGKHGRRCAGTIGGLRKAFKQAGLVGLAIYIGEQGGVIVKRPAEAIDAAPANVPLPPSPASERTRATPIRRGKHAIVGEE